jgi:Toprim domain/DNA primase catalytic core, N-terminal domain
MMAPTWVDFKQLKADVAIEEVLAHYGLRLRRIGATELRGRCPLPTHTSSRSRDSFAVNIARNVWSCRSLSCMQARGGKPGGNVLDLVALMESCSIRDAALRLQDWNGTRSLRRPVRASTPLPECNPPLQFALHYVNGDHVYLKNRGLTTSTIRTFGVGFYSGRGFLRGRIVVPIHNEHGQLIAYIGRAIGDEVPKYRFPTGFKKSLALFNLHRAAATGARAAIVVEGFFDCFAVHQAGYPTVVALMGSTLSPRQAELLVSHFDRAMLLLDGDEAGRQGTAIIGGVLAARMPVHTIGLQDGMQPDGLAPGEIQRLVRSYVHESSTSAAGRVVLLDAPEGAAH